MGCKSNWQTPEQSGFTAAAWIAAMKQRTIKRKINFNIKDSTIEVES